MSASANKVIYQEDLLEFCPFQNSRGKCAATKGEQECPVETGDGIELPAIGLCPLQCFRTVTVVLVDRDDIIDGYC